MVLSFDVLAQSGEASLQISIHDMVVESQLVALLDFLPSVAQSLCDRLLGLSPPRP